MAYQKPLQSMYTLNCVLRANRGVDAQQSSSTHIEYHIQSIVVNILLRRIALKAECVGTGVVSRLGFAQLYLRVVP